MYNSYYYPDRRYQQSGRSATVHQYDNHEEPDDRYTRYQRAEVVPQSQNYQALLQEKDSVIR